MVVMKIPKHKPLRVKPQKNKTRNYTHGHGAHNPWIKPNDSNYELWIWDIIIRYRIKVT